MDHGGKRRADLRVPLYQTDVGGEAGCGECHGKRGKSAILFPAAKLERVKNMFTTKAPTRTGGTERVKRAFRRNNYMGAGEKTVINNNSPVAMIISQNY